ncbi:MAG: hypothetical protein KBB94_01465 [Legionellaceae bacterium]|nr:hypothetical protein [Legionellaceae bacterium]MBP9774627.1 hypothetical protein [Legionellaceae bacterium]
MSTITMQEELTLALRFRDTLHAMKPQNHTIEVYDAIEPELLKLLYAENKDLSDLAYQKIKLLLSQNLDSKNPTFIQLQDLLSDLHQRRNRYLISVSKGFLGFWAEENWAGANLALLVLPLLAGGLFFPLAGVGLLVYTAVVAASAAMDVARKSPDYWLEESSPDARELTDEQRNALQQQYENIDLFLPENHPEKDEFKFMNRQSYGLYVLVFGIALLGLASLLFPPIGIPAIALTVLSIVAAGATGMQVYFMVQKNDHVLAEIEHEQRMSPVATFTEHDSTVLINKKLPYGTIKEQNAHREVSLTESQSSVKPMPHLSTRNDDEADDTDGEGGPHL